MQPASAKRLALLAAAVAHLVVSLFFVEPGHFSIDEGTYHWMVRDRAAGHGFEIVNGYRETPSPELMAATLVAHDGRLAAVPPDGFTLLALPFYLALGYRGLFLLQALAFLAAIALCGHLARRLSGDRELALDAMLLLALATFFWDYSQAAWPHALAACLVLAAFVAAVQALDRLDAEGGHSGALAWAAAAGLVAGVGVTVRLDSVFGLAAVTLPFLFLRPPRWRCLLAVAAGASAPLLALAAANRVKFGVFSPFSYGLDKESGEIGAYAAPLIAGAFALVGLWLASRRSAVAAGRRWLAGRSPVAPAVVALAAALAAAAVVAAVPALRAFATSAASGLWQLVVDFRPRPDILEPALRRTEGGAMVYLGSLKKSLLQSCPYLVALVLPVAAAWARPGRDRRMVLLLALVPAAYLGFYGAFGWHGGMALNLRYWTPALPFLAILAALAWRQLRRHGPVSRVVLAAACLAFFAACLGFRAAGPSLAQEEAVYLDLPLALAAILLLLSVAAAFLPGRHRAAVARAATVLFLLAATWSAFVTFFYDAPRHRGHRAVNLAIGERLEPAVPDGATLFVHTPDAYYTLLEVDGLILAASARDGFQDFRRLVDAHLARGRPVVAAFRPSIWRTLGERGHLRGYRGQPLTPDGSLMRLERTPPTADPGVGAQAPPSSTRE